MFPLAMDDNSNFRKVSELGRIVILPAREAALPFFKSTCTISTFIPLALMSPVNMTSLKFQQILTDRIQLLLNIKKNSK